MADVDFVHEQYESDDYYTMTFKTKAEVDDHWGFRWRHMLRVLQRYTQGPCLLDVGAGNGYFVHLARTEFGMRADGVEISHWSMVYPPHHINLFTREALAKLLERSGFAVVEYSTVSTYINSVRKFDTRGLLFRRTLFQFLRRAGLGADHFLVCRKVAG